MKIFLLSLISDISPCQKPSLVSRTSAIRQMLRSSCNLPIASTSPWILPANNSATWRVSQGLDFLLEGLQLFLAAMVLSLSLLLRLLRLLRLCCYHCDCSTGSCSFEPSQARLFFAAASRNGCQPKIQRTHLQVALFRGGLPWLKT